MDPLSHVWPIHFGEDSIHEFSLLDCCTFLPLVLCMVHDDVRVRGHPWLIRCFGVSIEQIDKLMLK